VEEDIQVEQEGTTLVETEGEGDPLIQERTKITKLV
jgi:hypothetical protein